METVLVLPSPSAYEHIQQKTKNILKEIAETDVRDFYKRDYDPNKLDEYMTDCLKHMFKVRKQYKKK